MGLYERPVSGFLPEDAVFTVDGHHGCTAIGQIDTDGGIDFGVHRSVVDTPVAHILYFAGGVYLHVFQCDEEIYVQIIHQPVHFFL